MTTKNAKAEAGMSNREAKSTRRSLEGAQVVTKGPVSESCSNQAAATKLRTKTFGDIRDVRPARGLREKHEAVATDVLHGLVHLVRNRRRTADQFQTRDTHRGGCVSNRSITEHLFPDRELPLMPVRGDVLGNR